MGDSSRLVDVGDSLAGGRFQIEALLGAGGMASVFRATDGENDVVRAVKVLDPDLAVRQEIRLRFQSEAETMAKLAHPNVVPVYEVVDDGDYLFIVMEFIDGPSVLDLIDEGPLAPIRALEITSDVLAALTVAHAHGIIHRDIKPHNVLVHEDGHALVTDFGIARVTGHTDRSITKTGTVMGTWAFMSPEQRTDAKAVDPSSDIYSAGATLYAMLAGTTPPDLHAADQDPTIFDDIPRATRQLIRRSTRYWAWERYLSAKDMRNEVDRVRASLVADATGEREALRLRHDTPPVRAPSAPVPIPESAIPPQAPETARAAARSHTRPAPPVPQSRRPTPLAVRLGVGVLVVGLGVAWWSARAPSDSVPARAPIPPPVTAPPVVAEAPARTTVPELVHTPPSGFSRDGAMQLEAQVVGSNAYDRVVVMFRPRGPGPYREASLRKTNAGFRGSVPIDRTMASGIEYYVEARPYTSGAPVLRSASPNRPHRLVGEAAE